MKRLNVFFCMCFCAVAFAVSLCLYANTMPEGTSSGSPVVAGDTVSIAYPIWSSVEQISKSVYDAHRTQYNGIDEFYYTTLSANGGETLYWRYKVKFEYMSVSDQEEIVGSAHISGDALWCLESGDEASTRRYRHLSTGKYLRVEVSARGEATMSLVDRKEQSSQISHDWTDMLLYDQQARTFAYPKVTSSSTDGQYIYCYYDTESQRWSSSRDEQLIHPMYYEKWSYRHVQHPTLSTYVNGAETASPSFGYSEDAAEVENDYATVQWVVTVHDSTYYYCVPGEIYNYPILLDVEKKEITRPADLQQKYGVSLTTAWKNANATNEKETWLLSSQIHNQAVAEFGAPEEQGNRPMMSYSPLVQNEEGWVTVVKPIGVSPHNVARMQDGVFMGWQSFYDTLMVQVSFIDGDLKEQSACLRCRRESYHYSPTNSLQAYLPRSTYEFAQGGETKDILADSIVYSKGYGLYTSGGSVIWEKLTQSQNLSVGEMNIDFSVTDRTTLAPADWLQVGRQKEDGAQVGVELTAAANHNSTNRHALLSGKIHANVYNYATQKDYYEIEVSVNILQKGTNTAGRTRFVANEGMGGYGYDANERQYAPTVETTIYYHPGERVMLSLRERNFFGYMRWYDYHTGKDPKYDAQGNEIKNFWEQLPYKSRYSWNGIVGPFDSINGGDGKTSRGLYYYMGYAPDINIKNSEVKSSPCLPSPIVNTTYWADGAERDIACDVSNYIDGIATDTLVKEPTLSYRHIFHLKPASAIADTLDRYVPESKRWFEEYHCTVPTNVNFALPTRYVSAKPFDDASELSYYFNAEFQNPGATVWRDTLMRLDNRDGYPRIYGWWYLNGYDCNKGVPGYKDKNISPKRSNNDYINPLITEWGGAMNINSTVHTDTLDYKVVKEGSFEWYGASWGGKGQQGNARLKEDTIQLFRFIIDYVDKAEYGPSKTPLITKEEIERNYIMLAECNFDYDEPGTDKSVLYSRPLPSDETTYGFVYPASVTDEGKKSNRRCPPNTPNNKDPFAYYGEYALINKLGEGVKTEQGTVLCNWFYPISQHGGGTMDATKGYCLYVDGAQKAGKLVSLSTKTRICSGQQLFCSAWIANPAKTSSAGQYPNLRFDVEGRNGDGEWQSVGSFYTGEILNGRDWLQIRFPLVSAEDYDESRVSIYNFAPTNSGNDFLIDDVYLYATRLPLAAYQATTQCTKGDKIVTLVRVDYTHLTYDWAGKQIYYHAYNVTDDEPIKTKYYRHAKDSTYGSIIIPQNDFDPTEDTSASVYPTLSELVGAVGESALSEDTTFLAYIPVQDKDDPRYILYLAQLMGNGEQLNSKKEYEVRLSTRAEDLGTTDCALRTKLPIYERTAYLFNGETYPAEGQCANGLYPLEILVTNQLQDGDQNVTLSAIARGDWLKGISSDDIFYDALLGKDTTGLTSVADAKFEAYYGCKRDVLTDAITDMRKDSTLTNFRATKAADLVPSEFTDKGHYDLIVRLCNENKLILAKESQYFYMHSQDSVRYWLYPTPNTAKVNYTWQYDENKRGTETLFVLNECSDPAYLMVFADTSKYDVNLAPKHQEDMTDDEKTQVANLRISISKANKRFGIPITKIGAGVAFGWDSTQVVASTDPIVKARLGLPTFSMRYTQDRLISDSQDNYYAQGDTIYFTPIDDAHIQALMNRHDNPKTTDPVWGARQPGFWQENTYSMRAGYEYTLRMQLVARKGLGVIDKDDDKGCLLGYAYFNVLVVPDTMLWTPTETNEEGFFEWGNDANWRAIENGKTLSYGYAPLAETMVILPSGLEDEEYPYITNNRELYSMDVHYTPNTCKKIQFREGAHIAGQENLHYEEAFVDMTLNSNGWYTLAAPLQDMYSGDMFVPHAGLYGGTATVLESTNDFEVSDFKGRRDGAAAYAFWAAYYNTDVQHIATIGDQTINSTTAAFAESNSLDQTIKPGEGFAAVGYGPTDDIEKLTIRLPKNDTKYYYFNSSDGQQSDRFVTLGRGAAKRLAFTPAADGSMKITLRNKVASRYFLFGNPTMSYIKLSSFLTHNSSVQKTGVYYLEEAKWYTVNLSEMTAAGSDFLIPPMRSVLLATPNATTELTLTLDKSDLTLVKPLSVDVQSDKRRSNTKHFVRPEVMNIVAYNQESAAHTSLVVMDMAHNEYNPDEDMPFISTGVEAFVNQMATTPINIYTLAGQQPLMSDVREAIGVVPVGVLMADECRTDSITLYFGLNSVWESDCYLCDSKTGNRYPINNDTRVRIATPGNHELRYYIQGPWKEPANPDTPVDNISATDDSENQNVLAFSSFVETVSVVAASDIDEVRVYDVAGRLLQQIKPSVQTSVLTLHAPTGVVFLEVTLRSAIRANKKVLVQ